MRPPFRPFLFRLFFRGKYAAHVAPSPLENCMLHSTLPCSKTLCTAVAYPFLDIRNVGQSASPRLPSRSVRTSAAVAACTPLPVGTSAAVRRTPPPCRLTGRPGVRATYCDLLLRAKEKNGEGALRPLRTGSFCPHCTCGATLEPRSRTPTITRPICP